MAADPERGMTKRRLLVSGGILGGTLLVTGATWGIQWLAQNREEKKVREEPTPQEVSMFGRVIGEHLQRASSLKLFEDLEEHKPHFDIGYASSASATLNSLSLFHESGRFSWLVIVTEPGTYPAGHTSTQLDLSFSVRGVVDLDLLAYKAEQLFKVPEELNDISWSSDGPIVGQVSKTREVEAPDGNSYSYYLNVTAYKDDPTMNFSRARLIVRFPESDTGSHYFTPRQLTIR